MTTVGRAKRHRCDNAENEEAAVVRGLWQYQKLYIASFPDALFLYFLYAIEKMQEREAAFSRKTGLS